MKAEKKLKLSIEALVNFGVYPEIIKDMLNDLKLLMIEKGKKFGKWTVITTLPRKKNKQTYWLCECECGYVLEVKSSALMNGKSTQCSNCAKKQVGFRNRKGYEEISGDMWSQMKKNAVTKKINFNLRIEEAWDLFIKQNMSTTVISNTEKQKLYTQVFHLLGLPVRGVELTEEQMDTFLELSLSEYEQYVNDWLIESQWSALAGLNVDTQSLTRAFTT
jgi:hypothetical protein